MFAYVLAQSPYLVDTFFPTSDCPQQDSLERQALVGYGIGESVDERYGAIFPSQVSSSFLVPVVVLGGVLPEGCTSGSAEIDSSQDSALWALCTISRAIHDPKHLLHHPPT